MRIGIIGAGRIGGNAARPLTQAGHAAVELVDRPRGHQQSGRGRP